MSDPVVPNRKASLSSVMDSTDDRVARRPSSSGRTLEQSQEQRRLGCRCRQVRMFQFLCRSLPVLTPNCGQLKPGVASLAQLSAHTLGLPAFSVHRRRRDVRTGTLFGLRDRRVALALQTNPRCRPLLRVELALPTHVLLRELGITAGARIVLETDKHSKDEDGSGGAKCGSATGGFSSPIWSMFCNGKRVGYAVRREPTEDDIAVLETRWAVSMGGGVLPGPAGTDGEIHERTAYTPHMHARSRA